MRKFWVLYMVTLVDADPVLKSIRVEGEGDISFDTVMSWEKTLVETHAGWAKMVRVLNWKELDA